MKKLFLFFPILFFSTSCYYGPAVNESYDFAQVGTIEIVPVKDHTYMTGSGEMVKTSLSHNFLKYGFNVHEAEEVGSQISIGNGEQTLELSCIITEYTDAELIVVPYRYEDRGSTTTTVSQSASADADKDKSNTSSSTTTKTDGGAIHSGSKVDYTRARVGIMLKMRDADSGALVWSNSYWYSGLELHRATEICVRNGVNQVRKLFQ